MAMVRSGVRGDRRHLVSRATAPLTLANASHMREGGAMHRSIMLAMLLAACGSRQAKPVTEHDERNGEHEGEEEQETERGAIPDDVVGPPKVAWKDLDHEQRVTFMKRVVMPTMQPLFVAFDGTKFHDFTCATCHGDARVKDGKFTMPNPDLLVLPEAPEAFQKIAEQKPEWVKFMATEVKPEMAKLLGIAEFDPAHPDPGAFGCRRCHP
jgi:hypothetical protein